jgi:subtilase family serine protease
MVKKKWLVIAGMIVALLLALSSIAAAPVQAASNPWRTMQSQPGHFSSPIHYGQVAEPVTPDKPGRGPSGTTSVVYTPSMIQTAYNFVSTDNGANEKIAIIDAYGDPTLTTDVAAFDKKFNLTTGSISVYDPNGSPVITRSNQSDAAGWAIETALDVEWAQANAPDATIDLVVGYNDSFSYLLNAVNYAIGLSPTVISMSFGTAEDEFTANTAKSTLSPWEIAFNTASGKGIILVASSGDGGATEGTGALTVDYPAASQYVIGVGGTTLNLTSAGGYVSETAWSDSGGGYGAASLSSVFGSEPGFQTSAKITDSTGMRGVPDVAFDANPNTGVYVYQNGWWAVGGTSVGAPNWAAIVADYAGANSLSLNLTNLYGAVYGNTTNYPKDIHDITSGNNGHYSAGTGWDAVTGIGTPNVGGLLTTP